MFRITIIFACLLHVSIGAIIRGRILLDGDEKKSVSIPYGTYLIVSLQDTSLADAPAVVIKELKFSNIPTLPYGFQMEISTSLSPIFSYSLSARITKDDNLLFINDQYIPVTIRDDNPIQIDVPVISVQQGLHAVMEPISYEEMERHSWPELVGREGTYAVQYIKEKTGLTNVFTILENSPITMDYRNDRVRIVINKDGIVTQVPHIG